MKKILLLLLVPFTASLQVVVAQSALTKAQGNLESATQQYKALSNKVALEEAKLVREVEGLDDEALSLAKEYKALEKEELLRTSKKQRLTTEIEKREIEFKFNNGVFDRYLREIKNKLHVAEYQKMNAEFQKIEADLEGAGSDAAAKVNKSLPLLKLGITRLLDLAGGAIYEGKAQTEEALVVGGKFGLIGPIGYFSSSDGSLAGVTDEVSGAVEFPSVIPLDPSAISDIVKGGEAVVTVDGSLGKAFKLEKAKKGFGDYLKGGGMVGYAIVGLGIVALLIGLWKLIAILQFHVPSRKKINELLDAKLTGDDEEADRIASSIPGLSGKMAATGMKYFRMKRRILEDALFEKYTAIPPALESGLPFLSLVAASAPMLGLLGTVLGIMKTFALMSSGGSSNIKFISAGISEALITTFMGLTVAIPILLIHGLLKSLAKGKAGEAEGVAMAIVNGTSEIVKEVDEEVEDLTVSPA